MKLIALVFGTNSAKIYLKSPVRKYKYTRQFLAMEGSAAFDNVDDNVTTTIFMRDNTIVGKRTIKIDGKWKYEKWYNAAGNLHHDSEPASIHYKNDKVCSQYWYKNGLLHRIGEPAIIHYHEDGRISKSWYEGDKRIKDATHIPGENPAAILAEIRQKLAVLERLLTKNAQ